MNYRITVQYDGTRYKGWQVQNSTDMTIQGKLQEILGRMTGEEVEVIGSGRTDAGVHAKGQVANFHISTGASKRYHVSDGADEKTKRMAELLARRKAENGTCEKISKTGIEASEKISKTGSETYENIQKFTPEGIKNYLNKYLPGDIAVANIEKVDERFHSRYNAKSKWYRYRIHISEQANVFEQRFIYTYTAAPLDVEKMKQAAAQMVGRHDFKSFCGNTKMKKSTVRTVTNVDIKQKGSEIIIDFKGEGFLQNMIRIMVGTLVEVGDGRRPAESIAAAIEAEDRGAAGFTAPPQGLCLMRVYYDGDPE